MSYLGKVALILSALISIFCSFYLIPALRSRKPWKKRRVIWNCYWSLVALFGTVTVASLVLLAAFISKDFTFEYVASHCSADMAVIYRVAAFWAGQEGSLLFWLWMITGFTALLAYRKLGSVDRLDGYALVVLNFVQLFFLVLLIVTADPFKLAVRYVETGMGINPLLLHWAMIIHPPTLFLGYAGLTVPFAYALAALFAGDAEGVWVKRCRLWTLGAWVFLSIGIYLGAVWAYVVLGWGGYWGWDPVENASFLPWLTGLALLHSFTAYRHRGSFKIWSLSLAIISFFLVILGTFVTRSGLIESVHAFGKSPLLSVIFGVFLIFILFGGLGLVAYRWRVFKTEEHFESLLSKSFTYHLNNIFLVLAMLIILAASIIAPLFGAKYDATFYNRLAWPIGIFYLALITICPLLVWRKTNPTKFAGRLMYPAVATVIGAVPLFFYWQNLEKAASVAGEGRKLIILGYIGLLVCVFAVVSVIELYIKWAGHLGRRSGRGLFSSLALFFKTSRAKAGGYLAHLGIAIAVAGLIGSSMYPFNVRSSIKNKPGEIIKISNYQLKLKGLETRAAPNKMIYESVFSLQNRKTKKSLGQVSPRIVYYQIQQQDTREVDIKRELLRDVFVILEGVEKDKLIVNIFINPLISWLWAGGIIMVLGTCIAMWPQRRREQS